jgi:hypothetical protein
MKSKKIWENKKKYVHLCLTSESLLLKSLDHLIVAFALFPPGYIERLVASRHQSWPECASGSEAGFFFYNSVCVCVCGDGIQGLVHAGQVLYHWTILLVLEWAFLTTKLFNKMGLIFFIIGTSCCVLSLQWLHGKIKKKEGTLYHAMKFSQRVYSVAGLQKQPPNDSNIRLKVGFGQNILKSLPNKVKTMNRLGHNYKTCVNLWNILMFCLILWNTFKTSLSECGNAIASRFLWCPTGGKIISPF